MNAKYKLSLIAFAAAAGLMAASAHGSHALLQKDAAAEVKKIAAAIQKGKGDDAKKMAVALAKKTEDFADFMNLFKPADKGGLLEKGIEKQIQQLAKKAPANAKGLEEMGYLITAMADVTVASPPAKDGGMGKTKKAWAEYADSMHAASIQFTKAAAAGNLKGIQQAANTLNNACVGCHAKFK